MGTSFASQKRTYFYNLNRYGLKLSKDEIKQIIITSLIIAFVWSFNKFGSDRFSLVQGLTNFAIGALFSLICIFFNQIIQRFFAVYYGYDPVYEYGILGLMIALVITFASRGLFIFFLPGGITLRHLAASRLGEFRYYTNDWEWAKVGFTGPFMNIALAAFLSLFKDIPIVRQLMIFNIMFAIYSLIPIPGNLGLYLFYPHIYFWTFTVAFVAFSSFAIFFLNPIVSIIAGMIIGGIALYWHFVIKDQKLGTGF